MQASRDKKLGSWGLSNGGHRRQTESEADFPKARTRHGGRLFRPGGVVRGCPRRRQAIPRGRVPVPGLRHADDRPDRPLAAATRPIMVRLTRPCNGRGPSGTSPRAYSGFLFQCYSRPGISRATFYRHLPSPDEKAGVDGHREESARAARRSAKRSRPGRPRANGAK
jgi:hypothetical protein